MPWKYIAEEKRSQCFGEGYQVKGVFCFACTCSPAGQDAEKITIECHDSEVINYIRV